MTLAARQRVGGSQREGGGRYVRLAVRSLVLTLLACVAGCANGAAPDLSRSSTPTTIEPANILDNASFETGWDGFTDWSADAAPSGVSRDSTQASDGSWSIVRSWTPNPNSDVGSQLLYQFGSADRIWIRFYFKLTAPVTTVMKFARFYDTRFATSFGGFYLGSGNDVFDFGTDEENGSIVTPIGVTQAQVIDGRWHSLEMDYWRNGDPTGFPSAAFWLDGQPASMPDGTPVKYACPMAATCNASFWRGGRLYSGQRVNTAKMGFIEWVATLNAGNTTTGRVNLDNIAMSTSGRIGP